MKHTWLSIVVPVYNTEEQTLKRCMDSLLGQTFEQIEIILVDDGAPGRCSVWCDQYAERDARVRVIHQPNSGVSVARNVAMEAALGEWITFVDADDWVQPSMCQTMYDKAQKVDADILMFSCYVNQGEEQHENPFFSDAFRVFAGESKDDIILQCINGSSSSFVPPYETVHVSFAKLYKTSFLKEHDLRFMPGIEKGHDTVFQIYALERAESVLYVNEPVYHHTKEADGAQYYDRLYRMWDVMLSELFKYIETFRKPQSFYDAYYARVNASLLSAVESDYFHPDNKKPYRARRNALKRLTSKQPYKEALQHVAPHLFTKGERFGLWLLRWRLIRLCALFWNIIRRPSKTA